ncbi:MAG: ABC transporter ATP-binding protein [Ardenticatenales bacterium]|nr:ABC transporter ATP-binding protein [Ardenticatenales bacterium]
MALPLKQYWSLLIYYLSPQWGKALLLALLLLTSTGLQLLNPQILRYFIDTALNGEGTEKLGLAALAFLGVGLANQLLAALATYFGADVGWTATNLLRADLALHCLRLDMPFHNERTPGEFIERIDGDVTALSDFFSQFVVRVVGSSLLLVGVLVLLFREDWRVGTALTIFTLLAYAVLSRTHDFAVAATTDERQSSAQLFGFLEERLSGIHDIRANGAGAYTMRRFYEVAHDFFYMGRQS